MGNIKELDDILQALTGMTIRESIDLGEEEQIERINEHSKPCDVFKEAIDEMRREGSDV